MDIFERRLRLLENKLIHRKSMIKSASHYSEPHLSYSRVLAHESLWIDSNDIPLVAPSPLYDTETGKACELDNGVFYDKYGNTTDSCTSTIQKIVRKRVSFCNGHYYSNELRKCIHPNLTEESAIHYTPVLEDPYFENIDNHITQIDIDSGCITLNRHWEYIYISLYVYTGRIGLRDLTVDDIAEKGDKRFYTPSLLQDISGPIGNVTDIKFNSGNTINVKQVGNEATLHVNGEPLRIPSATITPPLPSIPEERKVTPPIHVSQPRESPIYSPSHNTYDSLSIGTRAVDSELTVSGNVCIVGKHGNVKMKCNSRDTLNIPRLSTTHINTYGLNLNNQSIVNVDVLSAMQVVVPELTFIYSRDSNHEYCDIFEDDRLLGRMGRAPDASSVTIRPKGGRVRVQTPDQSFFTTITTGIVWVHADRIEAVV